MQRNQLEKWDAQFEVVGSQENFSLMGIMGLENYECLKPQHIIFIKDIKFAQKCFNLLLGEELNPSLAKTEVKPVGVIFNHKLWEKLRSKEKDKSAELLTKVAWVATTQNIDRLISESSKFFYEKLWGATNDIVDGRQMGTAVVHPTAWIAQGVFVGEGVKIAEGVKIHPGVVIMANCEIDEYAEIFPNTTLYYGVKIGTRTRIHSGCVIGADGFGYNHQNGEHLKIWHMGSVEIGSDVEIGANSNIDSGTFSPTRIGNGSKIDNHVQIGHNSQLGRGVIVCGQVGISGSNIIGDYCVFGGKAGTGDNIELGAGCQIAGNAMVNRSWPAQSVVAGHPARPLKEWMRGLALVRKLSQENK